MSCKSNPSLRIIADSEALKSYFGMNLQDIANTKKTQSYFWAVCGSITLFVVSFTVVFGFKQRLYGWIWANRDYSRARELEQ